METIGNKLKAAREKIKLSRADVAKAVRINTQYIEAIENNEFHKLIAPIYAKGFIKLYAQCVQLDPAPLLCQFKSLEVSVEPAPAGRELPDKKEVLPQKKHRFLNVRFATLLDVIKKRIKRIKLPETRQLSVPFLKPLKAPAKKWLVIIIVAAVLCAVILPVLVKYMTASKSNLRVPPSCRWIVEPPEPYLNMPATKSLNSR